MRGESGCRGFIDFRAPLRGEGEAGVCIECQGEMDAVVGEEAATVGEDKEEGDTCGAWQCVAGTLGAGAGGGRSGRAAFWGRR